MEEHDWSEFEGRDRIAAWDALAQCAAEPNPFYESWYLLPSLRALDRRGDVTLLTLQANGQLAGLMPVLRTRDYYGHPIPHLRNWLHPNCFCGQPLVAKGLEQEFWQALLAWCDGHAGLSLFLHLSHAPAHGPLRSALKSVLAGEARPAAEVMREERAMLHTAQPAEDYFAQSVSAKKRKELRRQHRRLAEEGDLSVERLTDYSQVAEWTRDFLELESRGWKGDAGSALNSDHDTRAIFQHAIAGAAARGRLERLAIRLDGRPIAMLATFTTGRHAFSFKTAYDEDYARFSPGVLLQRENLAMLEQDGFEWADSCASPDHPMIDHIWRERRVIERLSIGIGGALRRAAFSTLIRLETGRAAGGIS
ncbi:GNAT family N-acetyltransferase [Erythrobacter sp. GH3-10]|uniref:GNAT family N-acetyltransferase n=1 Tax=Aurantiacibacter rhizosphaerae TaxID=2691582 RepID=A0A844XBA0_9SPHN|nr:GNAT family N-acetyltransferase [Aurantiacibacter rhizosphaerae]